VRIEYAQGTWAVVDPSHPAFNLPFDQALVDVAWSSHNAVEGMMKSVHGISQEDAEYLNSRLKGAVGIGATHRLGRVGTLRRMRLLPGGRMELVS
jgi:hypothetical protein